MRHAQSCLLSFAVFAFLLCTAPPGLFAQCTSIGGGRYVINLSTLFINIVPAAHQDSTKSSYVDFICTLSQPRTQVKAKIVSGSSFTVSALTFGNHSYDKGAGWIQLTLSVSSDVATGKPSSYVLCKGTLADHAHECRDAGDARNFTIPPGSDWTNSIDPDAAGIADAKNEVKVRLFLDLAQQMRDAVSGDDQHLVSADQNAQVILAEQSRSHSNPLIRKKTPSEGDRK